MEDESRKSLSSILGDIGEKTVGYELLKRNWDVNLNLSAGYDLYIRRGDVGRRIEVKTTDPFEKSGKYEKHFRFAVTDKEMADCDFVIIYFHGESKYFIIPKKNIPKNGIVAFYRRDDGSIGEDTKYKKYENNWQILE